MKRVPGAVLGLSGACRANREALLPPPVLGSHHSCSDEGRLEEVHTHPARLWRVSTVGLQVGRLPVVTWGSSRALPEKHILPRHGSRQPWWQVAFPWPASLLEGMPHISGPRSDNLVNLRAASSTCYCSGTLPTGSGHGILQCLLLSGRPRYSCWWPFVLVAKPPAPAHLSEAQAQQAWLSFPELSESQRKCQCAVYVPCQLHSCQSIDSTEQSL